MENLSHYSFSIGEIVVDSISSLSGHVGYRIFVLATTGNYQVAALKVDCPGGDDVRNDHRNPIYCGPDLLAGRKTPHEELVSNIE